MPRLNKRGEYLTGVGGGGGNLFIGQGGDNVGTTTMIGAALRPILCAKIGIGDSGEGSGWYWKDDDTIAGQFCGDPTNYDQRFGLTTGCSTWAYNLKTGVISGPFGPGANNGSGRAGVAGFWLGTGGYGAYTSTGYRDRVGAFAGAFANGDFLILKDYQQSTLGFDVIHNNAKIQDVATVGQMSGAKVCGNIAIWYDFGTNAMGAYGHDAPVKTTYGSWNLTGGFASDKNGRLWICNGQEGLLLRAWDQPVGYWLSHDGFNYWPDVVALPDGRLRIVTSEHIGELPGTTRVWDLDPLTGAFTFGRGGGGLTTGTADLINLETGAPAVLQPPAKPASTTHTAGVPTDLFPFAVAAFGLGAYYLLTRE
jgi:hypothetical protein